MASAITIAGSPVAPIMAVLVSSASAFAGETLRPQRPAPAADIAWAAQTDLFHRDAWEVPPLPLAGTSLGESGWMRSGAFPGTPGWPMRGNDMANTSYTHLLGPSKVSAPAWTYAPGSNVYVWRPAVDASGTIYLNTVTFPGSGVDGRLVALHRDGQVKWVTPLTDPGGQPVWASATPVLDAQGNIYVAWAHNRDFGNLTALSLDSAGTIRWRYQPKVELEHASHQQPVLANGVLYTAADTSFRINDPTHRSSIVALDAATGARRWRWDSPNLDTFFDGPVVGADGAIYLASAENGLRNAPGYLYRVLADGTLDWSVNIGAGSNAAPALGADDSIYFGGLVGVLHCYDPNGILRWSYHTQTGRIYNSPALWKDRVLVGTAYGGLHVVDAAQGSKIHVFEPTFYPMSAAADRAGNAYFYCFDASGTVFGFGREGRRMWTHQTGAGVSVNAVVLPDHGRMLVSDSRRLVAYTGPFVGDLNCDGAVDFGDVNAFVLALGGEAGYYAVYRNCHWYNGDINGDGSVDFGDINEFVELLAED